MRAERVPAEPLAAAALAALSAALVVGLGPPAIDAPAHLYRTELVRHGVYLWDNLWYGGQYPLGSYSLLYYLPAALVGNVPLVAAAVVVSAALFASLLLHEWGDVGRWPARAFALLAGGPLLTGTYSYAVGLAFLLGTLRAFQARRARLACVLAALTLGFSPLAFVFLCLALLAVACSRRRLGRPWVLVALAAIGAVELAVLALFPSETRYPFHVWPLLGVLTTSVLGVAIARRAKGGGVLLAFFLLWGLVCIAAFVVPTPVGSNLTRLRFFVFPLGLLTVLLTGFRPRLLTALGLALGLVYTLVPYVSVLPNRGAARAAQAFFWQPVIDLAARRAAPSYRVEVVPTFDHWEAYWVPRSGAALARGWYRQLDLAENPFLYRRSFGGNAYRAWLRRNGVRYVVLPRVPLDGLGASAEARLLRSGSSRLRKIAATPTATIWELSRPTPILTGPGPAQLTVFAHERIVGEVGRPGDYLLRVRWTPYWRVGGTGECVERASGGQTLVRVRRPGRFELTSDLEGSTCPGSQRGSLTQGRVRRGDEDARAGSRARRDGLRRATP